MALAFLLQQSDVLKQYLCRKIFQPLSNIPAGRLVFFIDCGKSNNYRNQQIKEQKFMKKIIWTILIATLFSTAVYSQTKKIESVFTEFETASPGESETKNCQHETISGNSYPPVFLVKCKGIGDYKLKELSNAVGSAMLSVISPSGQEQKIDYFENIGYGTSIERKVEWRVRREGKQVKPIALIVGFENIENLDNLERTSYLGVIKLTEKAVCLTDVVESNQKSDIHRLADSSAQKPCLLEPSYSALFLKKLEDEIPILINKLAGENDTARILAANALVKVGAKAIAPLIESLKRNKHCESQMLATEAIRKIDSRQEIIKTSLFEIAGGNCGVLHLHDTGAFFAMVGAATILAKEIEGGIPLVTKLLKEKGGMITAIYAFSDLLDSVSNNKKSEIKPEIIRDLKAAIPILVEGLENNDEKLRCGYFHILQMIQKSGFEELETEANRALEGKKVDCPK